MGSSNDLREVGGAFIKLVPSLRRNVQIRRMSWFPSAHDLAVGLHPYGSVAVGFPPKGRVESLVIVQRLGATQTMRSAARNRTDLFAVLLSLVSASVQYAIDDIDQARVKPSILLDRKDLERAAEELEHALRTSTTL